MGTDTLPPSNAVETPARPADSYSRDVTGVVAELRVISFLLAEGFGLDVDLDALRQQFVNWKL